MSAKCDQCSFTAPYDYNIKSHKLWNHSDHKPFGCTYPGCSYRTKGKSALNVHKRIHETDMKLRKPYPCTFDNCEYRGAQQIALTSHLKAKHSPGRTKDMECPLCPSKFYRESYLKEHIQLHTKETEYTCIHCDFKTPLKRLLNDHLKNIHENSKKFACSFPGCNFRTGYASNLKAHCLRRHDRDPAVRRPFPCSFPTCSYRAGSVLCLKIHIRAMHNPERKKEVTCPMCDKEFYNAAGLRAHIRHIHSHETIYYCKDCEFSSRYTRILNAHYQRVHRNGAEKPFKCEYCAHRSLEKRGIANHVRTVHSTDKKFKCTSPGCSFKTNEFAFYKRHLLSHEEDPNKRYPLACTVPTCDFRCRLNPQMKIHMELHQKSKLIFECTRCDNKHYPDKKSLRFHTTIRHRKSYKCSMCDYFVFQKAILAKHYNKNHLPSFIRVQKTYKCSKCDFQGKKTGCIDRHVKRRHRELISSEQTDQYESGYSTHCSFQCSICNYSTTDDHDVVKHSVIHRIPVVRLHRVHLLIL